MPTTAPAARRRGSLLTAAFAAGLVSACAVAPGARGGDAVEVAPGVYRVQGSSGEADPDNRGRVGNAGFIVGPLGVIAIDSGTSWRHGAALLETIRRTTALPVRALVLTHTRQEFLFGAAAFSASGIAVHMQTRAARLMAARCARCLKTLNSLLGNDEMQGTVVPVPDREFETSHLLAGTGRAVRVLYFGHSSGPGDVAVLDESTGVLFAGGLLDQQQIPDVQDSDLAGWQRALAELRALPIQRIVPGHGPVASAALIATVGRYLEQLQAGAAALLDKGTSLREVPDMLQLPDFSDWQQYDTIHRRNAAVVFLRLEQALLTR